MQYLLCNNLGKKVRSRSILNRPMIVPIVTGMLLGKRNIKSKKKIIKNG